MNKPVILTGLRANSDLHIGNYFGALLPLIKMAKNNSDKYQINLFVPDLHSFTTPIDHKLLQKQIMHNLRIYVASGLLLNHPDVHIYRQSYIPAHSELTLILNCFTGFGEMNRMTQFKDRSTKINADRISLGLFDYPVLMAADILLYGASYIPVGDDQTQHLEFTRDIAERLNAKFGELFKLPKSAKEQRLFFANDNHPDNQDSGLRIKDLVDPSKKMSKSDETGKGIIFLGDDPEIAYKKVMSATTDNFSEINYDPINQPGISNLLQILALITGKSQVEVNNQFQGQKSYGDLKKVVAEKVKIFLIDFQQNLSNVDDSALINKLNQSEKVMNLIANQTLYKVQKAVGLR